MMAFGFFRKIDELPPLFLSCLLHLLSSLPSEERKVLVFFLGGGAWFGCFFVFVFWVFSFVGQSIIVESG